MGLCRLEEVRMGGAKKQWTQADIDQLEREAQRTRDFTAYERAVLEYEDQQLGSDANNTGNQTKYGQYQLPGGENYREVVLAMPRQDGGQSMFNVYGPEDRYVKQFKTRAEAEAEVAQNGGRIKELFLTTPDQQNYTSTHFDTPNYVAHMRLNERVDAKGKQGLFIEELQSDRHQQGTRCWICRRRIASYLIEQGYRIGKARSAGSSRIRLTEAGSWWRDTTTSAIQSAQDARRTILWQGSSPRRPLPHKLAAATLQARPA
jgi:hypothetical protein